MEIVPTSPVGDPSISAFIQYLLSSFSIFPTSGRSFKQTLHSFKLTFLKQNHDEIIRGLKICVCFSYKVCAKYWHPRPSGMWSESIYIFPSCYSLDMPAHFLVHGRATSHLKP